MSDQTNPPNPTVDPYQYLKIVRNPDGTITRLVKIPNTAATPDPYHRTPVLSKDIPLNQSNNTWLRIFLPRQALDNSSPNKLPLIVYYHGGGFIICSAANTFFHEFCEKIAIQIPAVVVSVEYRLAPEHRLPAAYDDAVEALHWIETTHDAWLREYADFGNCFLMGTSAGGNIAYHAGLRAAATAQDVGPLKIQGLILHHPFFGGSERTGSELRLVNDPTLPLCGSDLMWELGLPNGVDRDHEYCNPMVDGGSQLIERMRLLGWRVLVTGCYGDPLIDRQMELARMMEGKSLKVVSQFSEGGRHGVDLFDPSRREALCVVLKKLVL